MDGIEANYGWTAASVANSYFPLRTFAPQAIESITIISELPKPEQTSEDHS